MSATLIFVNMCGAVALLLVGLKQIKSGINRAVGSQLSHALAVGTRTQPRAFLSGLGVTLLLQSSTATAMLAASFAKRGILRAQMGQIALLGANVGTALTAWIVSLNLGWVSPVLILSGFVMGKGGSPKRRGYGRALVGVGLVLLSLQLLSEASAPMRQSEALLAFIALLENAPIVALGLAAMLALLSSSSLAAIMMISAIAVVGTLSPILVLSLVVGANIGGAIPPVLMTLGHVPEVRRLTLANLAVRAVGGCAVLFALPLVVNSLTVPLSNPVALHVVFNVGLAVLAWPLSGLIARVFEWSLPDEGATSEAFGAEAETRFLSESDLQTPVVALANATREVLAIGDNVERMLTTILKALQEGRDDALTQVQTLEDEVDRRQSNVKLYLTKLTRSELTEEESQRAIAIVDYAINLEHVGDIAEKGLAAMAAVRSQKGLMFSDEGLSEILSLFSLTLDNLRSAQTVFATDDFALARQMIEAKIDIRRMERHSAQQHMERLRDGQAESLETSSLHLDILRDLKRINAHLVSVAHPILDQQGLLEESRIRPMAYERELG
ncbi:Na+/Pi-cotransporter [Pelagimonas phthalicica]|uniref:Na+/Pi-cotransporter n=1 Tax=Pelagimonas phthalicica TaxID=1037362 RepID=A0A238JF10_9RHOB|nr:Na/Pi cotransporter family protein [Pelagimonas phthalicica]TDS92159.1 phosphate:Na+ symporter [Pelagimonas phthalicica]SMX29219.1 Na+/Pi-cotransporter [Pelagimonas phthalicica]